MSVAELDPARHGLRGELMPQQIVDDWAGRVRLVSQLLCLQGHDHCVDGLSSGFLDKKYSLRGVLWNHLERVIHPNNLNIGHLSEVC
jgi:hypothetical protein